MDDFKLPEKWCIKPANTDEAEIIFEFEGINKHNDSRHIGFVQHYPPFKDGCTADYEINDGYTEITFEQFKEHVLNIKEEEPIKKEEDYSYLIKLLEEYKLT